MKKHFFKIPTKPFLFLSLFFSVSTYAQITDTIPTNPNEVISVDEVIVTAGRKSENINQIPSSVTVISQKQIQEQLEFTADISQIIGNLVPGLSVSNNKSNNAGQTLRGRAVLVLIDGIPQSTPLMNGSRDIRTIDPSVIERIEVIKGATSIYGNGSGGGIINYITKKNFNKNPISGQTSVGLRVNPYNSKETFGYRVSQFLSGNSNKFSYMVGGSIDYTGLQRDGEGLVLGQTDGTSNSYQNNVYTKLNYQINDESFVSVMYNFYNSTQHSKYISKNGVFGVSPTIGVKGEDPGKATGTPFNHNLIVRYNNNAIFGKTQFDASFYLNSFRSMNRYVQSATAWYGPGQTKINSNKKGIRLNFNTPFSLGNIPGEVTYGLDLLNDVTYQDLTDGRVYIPKMNMTSFAPYAQLKLDLFQDLVLKGGLRYENAQVKIKDFRTIADGPNGEGSIDVEGGKFPYKGTTFNAGLRYTKFDLFNPFVSFTQGFSINELGRIVRSAEESTLTNVNTKPILTNNYEVGFSSRYKMLNFTAAYFISTSSDGVSLVENSNGLLRPERAPERTYGFELTLDANISREWKAGATYAHVEGKSEKTDGSKKYLSGARVAPPKATAYLRFSPNRNLNLALNWLMTGDRNHFSPNNNGVYLSGEAPVKTINLFNLSGNYQLNQNWGVSLGIDNLFNTTYYTVASQYSANVANYVRGVGTTATFTVNYKF
jgi:iron complex outermembrane receptor protein